MNILVVDDEQVIRDGIMRTIRQSFPHIKVLTASSGQEALELLQAENFQAVFVDIMMPGFTGLELMAAYKQRNPGQKWIVISAYSEFAYAQEALRLGAKEYLLKPIGKDKLRQMIIDLEMELRVERRQLEDHDLLQSNLSYLREAVFRRWALELDIGRFDMSFLGKQYTQFYLLYVKLKQGEKMTLEHFIVENVLTELIGLNGSGFVAGLDHQSLLGVMSVTAGQTFDACMEEFRSHLDRYLKKEYNLLASGMLYDFEMIPAEVRKLRLLDDAPLEETPLHSNADMIGVALQYIKAHFDDNVSLEKVASTVFLNPIYFSQQFKLKTGIGYKEYVIGLRMERAKELLATTTMKIADIAEGVGYQDLRHFTQVFRKKLFMTPTEYRLSIRQVQ